MSLASCHSLQLLEPPAIQNPFSFPVTLWLIISVSALSSHCLSGAPPPPAHVYVQTVHILRCLWCSHYLGTTVRSFPNVSHDKAKEFPTVTPTSSWRASLKRNNPAVLPYHREATLVRITKFPLPTKTKECRSDVKRKEITRLMGSP